MFSKSKSWKQRVFFYFQWSRWMYLIKLYIGWYMLSWDLVFFLMQFCFYNTLSTQKHCLILIYFINVAGYQPGYQPMTAGHSSVTVIAQPGVMITAQQFREHPVRTKCPACQAEVMTSTCYETGTFAWVIALVLCLFG